MLMVYLNVMHRIHYNSEQTFTAKLRNFIDIYTSHRIYHQCTHACNSNNDKKWAIVYIQGPKGMGIQGDNPGVDEYSEGWQAHSLSPMLTK